MSVNAHLGSGDGAFQKNLAFGQMAETRIAKWLMERGAVVLPVYDIEYATGKGPRVFSAEKSLIAPDLLVFAATRQIVWIEAKHKTVFSWYRRGQSWVTGIDVRHYENYLRVRDRLARDVWLLFLHESSTPWCEDRRHQCCPERCPTGLFGNSLSVLESSESHRSAKHGTSGMVYWSVPPLIKLAELSEVPK